MTNVTADGAVFRNIFDYRDTGAILASCYADFARSAMSQNHFQPSKYEVQKVSSFAYVKWKLIHNIPT